MRVVDTEQEIGGGAHSGDGRAGDRGGDRRRGDGRAGDRR